MTTDWKIRGSIPGRPKTFFSSPKGPFSLLFNWTGIISRGFKLPERRLTTHHHPVPRLRMSVSVPLLPLHAVMVWPGITLRCHLTAPASSCSYCNTQLSRRMPRHSADPNGRHCTLHVTLHKHTVASATSHTRQLPGSHPTHGPAISRLSTVFRPLSADVVKTGHGRCRCSVSGTAPHLTHLTHTHSRPHLPSRLP